ncbi:MAG: hypothetical protein GXO39_02300 [Thermotogae bacterium]|nr:hypothetical protein [Thermotogota bacterium]
MDRIRLTLYAILFIALVLPFFFRPKVKMHPSPEVKAAYNFVDQLPDGCRVLFSIDYGPSSQPETHPMVIAMARHLLKKHCKIAVMTLWRFEGIMMGNDAMNYVTKKMGAEYGKDWVMLGFRPGITAVLTNIGTDFKSVFDVDVQGVPIDRISWLKDVKTIKDFDLVVDFAAGSTGESWVMITGARYGVPIIIGSTAVIAPSLYPLYQSGQIEGIIGGLKGAADYEYLIKHPGMATTGMLAQTGGHLVILLFIIIGNILYFFGPRERRRI